MYSRRFIKHPIMLFALLICAALLLFTACGNNSTHTSTLSRNITVNAMAILKPSPVGTAVLAWDPQSKNLIVKLSLTGLVPKSIHPAHIHTGSCKASGNVLYPLSNVVADEKGAATVTTVIRNVENGIPASGWSINVHNGPALGTAQQFLPIACADIANPHASVKATQSVRVVLTSALSPSQSASGTAQISRTNGGLSITITMAGLEPKSAHAVQVHAGSCARQGALLYTLQPLVADASGNGLSITTLSGLSASRISAMFARGWYVDIHLTGDLSSQTGSDLIACGDVMRTV